MQKFRKFKVVPCSLLFASIAFSSQAQIAPQTILEMNSKPKLQPDEMVMPLTPNPLTSLRPDGSYVNEAFWQQHNLKMAKAKALTNPEAKVKITGNKGKGTITLSKFGTNRSQSNTAQIIGEFSLPALTSIPQNAEDEGSIMLATETGVSSGNGVTVNGFIGDGPFGSSGTGTGDFDFFAIRAVAAGDNVVVEVKTPEPFAALDPFIIIYNSAGDILFFNDDGGDGFDSKIEFIAPADDDYFLSVGTFGNPILFDPFDSSTGGGVFFDNEGEYTAEIAINRFDEKVISFATQKGNVVGAALNGTGGSLTLIDKRGTTRQGSSSPAASSFNTGSPLPAGLVSVAHVVDEAGLFTLKVRGTEAGPFTLDVASYLPELREGNRGDVQTIFLDFDGETVDLRDSILDGFPFPAIASLSPLVDYLPSWGLTAADEDEVIDAIIERVEESLLRDIDQLGPNAKFRIELLNSRDHDDPFGEPNVSRVIVGGSRAELGFNTIGIAQSIDVGNYDTEETAFVLLDLLSGQTPSTIDLNGFPRAPGETIVDIIAVGVGEIVAHEAGHYLGCWHTDQFNDVANIMDQGGNLEFSILGLGPDGIFGTNDDTNVQFETDVFNPNEPFNGIENTNSAISFGATQPK